jgi:sugar O-acyltransferase (sialic acid O-acetyltransferase NeuD family)
MTAVTIPWTDVNDDSATVVEWHVEDRSEVRAGAALVDVETSKSAFEIESPADGLVLQLVPVGGEVSVGEPVAHVFEDEAALVAFEEARAQEAPSTPAAGDEVRASDKARARAQELGVDLAGIGRTGLITVKDVEAAAAASEIVAPQDLPTPLRGDGASRRLLLIGAGLGATQVLDILAETDGMQGVGVVDDNAAVWSNEVEGVPVVGGTDQLLEHWEAEAFDAVVIAISTSVEARARLRGLCREAGIPLANVIDPRSKLATGVTFGEGNVVCAYTHFGTGTTVGDNNFISAYNSFDHHNVLGSDISTGPGCMTSGEVKIEDRVRLGTGVFVEPKLTLGEGVIVASGSVIVRSVPAEHAVKTKVVTTTVVPIRRRQGSG